MKSKVFLIKTKGKVFLVETINETNVKIAPKDYSKVKTNVKSEGSDYSDDGNEKKQDPREVHFGAVDAEVRGEVKTFHALSLSLFQKCNCGKIDTEGEGLGFRITGDYDWGGKKVLINTKR